MMPIKIPISDVNSTNCTIVAWHAPDRTWVSAGDLLVEVETSKAVFEETAAESGVLLQVASEGSEIPLDTPIGFLFPDEASLAAFEAEQAIEKTAEGQPERRYRATAKAQQLAEEHGISLAAINNGRLITQKDVEAFIRQGLNPDYSQMPKPLSGRTGVERVILIGGGTTASQIIAILREDPGKMAVACVDDNPSVWGQEVGGVPIVGGSDRLGELHTQQTFDSAILALGGNYIPARIKLREACERLSIPLANAIDQTAKLSADTRIGRGNVISAFCYFGPGTVMGDNNFISAFNSFDHHSVIGSDTCTGPGCIASGTVKIGSRVRLGTGIFIEPNLELGDNAQVASGAIIQRSVPAGHAVKTKVITTTVVPIRP
jgi:acetyltransferase-like isoleucine patch superfamily enzyme